VSALASSAAPGRITLKVHPDNAAAARFYRRLGFVEQGMSSSGYRWFARDRAHRPDVEENAR
jgi:RimJ/RimL family protein N-acetyltransferase